MDIRSYLSPNQYPGRGILLGRAEDGSSVIAYFIMGRSENSRNRVFVEEGTDMRTKAFDPSKMTNPDLVIYYPVRRCGEDTVVTNGDQTDTVVEFLKQGKSFEDALRTRTFEPDPPIYTPRISGLLHADGSYQLSILKTSGKNPEAAQRFFYDYPQPEAGFGHIIHTYAGNGNPVPSFAGEPVRLPVPGDLDELTELVWSSLNEENRVSLYTCVIRPDGTRQTRIVNRNA